MQVVYEIKDENGVTDKERNLKQHHTIPLGALVEVVGESLDEHGCRLFVVNHSRDCDGTPLYDLSFNPNVMTYINELKAEVAMGTDGFGLGANLISQYNMQITKHFSAESLVFVSF